MKMNLLMMCDEHSEETSQSNLNISSIFQKTSKYRDILLHKITYVEHIIAYKYLPRKRNVDYRQFEE